MSGITEVEAIPELSLGNPPNVALRSHCTIKLLDPKTQKLLHEIPLNDLYDLDPNLLSAFGIKIWRGINALAISCETDTSIELTGNFPVNNLIVYSEGHVKLNAKNTKSSINIKAPSVEFTDNVATKSLVLDCAKVVAPMIDVQKDCEVHIANAADCTFRALSSHGKVTLKSSYVKCDRVFLPSEGELNIEKCILDVKKGIQAADNSAVSACDSTVIARTFAFKGTIKLSNIRLFGETLDFAHKGEVVNSAFKLKTDLRHAETAEVRFTDCTLETSGYFGNGKASFTKTKVNTKFFQQNAIAEYSDSIIAAVDIIDINDKQKATRTEFITLGQFCAFDDLDLAEGSKVVAGTYFQTAGKLKATASSVEVNKDLILEDAVLAALKDSKVTADFLSMSGHVDAATSELHANVAQVFSALDIIRTKMDSRNEFFVGALAKVHMLDSSSLKTAKAEVLGKTAVAEHSCAVVEQLEVLAQGIFTAKYEAEVVAKQMTIAGLADVLDAKLAIKEKTEVTGEVSLRQGSTAVLGDLTVEHGAQIVAQGDSIAYAKGASVHGTLILDESYLTAERKLELSSTSKAVLHKATLAAKKSVQQRGAMQTYDAHVKTDGEYTVATGAEITGSSLKVTAAKTKLAAQTKLDESLIVTGKTAEVQAPLEAKAVTFNVDDEVTVKAPIRAKKTTFDTDFLTFATGGSVTGDRMSAITYATTMQPGSRLNLESVDMQSFIYTNVGGLVAAYDSHISSVVDLDAGLTVPDLPSSASMPKSRAEAWEMARKSNKFWSVGTTLLSNISRPASSLAGMAMKSKSLYDSRDKIYAAWEHRHEIGTPGKPLRHYLSPLLQAKGLMVNAYGLYNEGANLYQSTDPLYETQSWSAAEKFGRDAFSLLGPSMTRESMFGLHAGANVSYTYNEQSVFSANAGFTGGNTVRVQTALDQFNFGTYEANTLNLECNRHHNFGHEEAHNKFIFTAREAHNARGGIMRGEPAVGEVKGVFVNDGSIAFKHGDFKAGATENRGDMHIAGMRYGTGKMHTAEGATTHVTEGSRFKADEYANDGKTKVDKSSVLDAKSTKSNRGELEVAADSKHFTKNLEVAAGAYVGAGLLAGGIIFGVDDEPDQFVPVAEIRVAEGADFKATGVVKAGEMQNEGAVALNAANVAVQSFNQAATGTTDVKDGSAFSTESGNIAGATKVAGSSTVALGKAELAKGSTVDVTGTSTLLGQDVTFAATVQVSDCSVAAIAKTTVAEGGTVAVDKTSQHFFDKTSIESGGSYANGGLAAKKVVASVDEEGKPQVVIERADEFTIEKDGSVTLSGVAKAQEVRNAGEMHAEDAYVEADKFTNDGKLECKKRVDIVSNEFVSTEPSTMHGVDGSLLVVETKKSELGGAYDAASLAILDESMDGVRAAQLVEHSGASARVGVRDTLTVTTKDDVQLGEINRDASVAVALEAGSVTTTKDMSLRKVSFKATDGDISLRSNVVGKESASVQASGDINKQGVALTSVHGDVYAECEGTLRNQDGLIKATEGYTVAKCGIVENNSTGAPGVHSTITGKVVDVKATKGHVDNTGGHIIGTDAAFVDALTDVINAALQKSVGKRFDTVTTYDPGLIHGGAGTTNPAGIGVYVHAGRELINAASSMGSAAKTVLQGDQGFRSETLSNTYTSHRDRHDVYQETEVGYAKIFGAHNYLESAQGGLNLHGVQTSSTAGTSIYSRGDLVLESHTYTHHHTRTESGCRSHKPKHDYTPQEKPNVIEIYRGDITVQSESAIRGLGAEFRIYGGGNLKAKSATSIDLSRRVLETKVIDRSEGWGISVAGQSFTNHTSSSWQERAAAVDPVFASIFKAGSSLHPLEAFNVMNAYDDVTRLTNDLATKGLAGTAMERTSAALSFSKTKTTTTYETPGAGGIYGATKVSLEAPNVTLGMSVSADEMNVKAKLFTLCNQELNSSYVRRQDTFTASLTPTGVLNGGVQRNVISGHSKSYTQESLNVSVLNLDVDTWDIHGFQVCAQTAGGRVGAINLHSTLDSQRFSSTTVGANTSGAVNFAHSKQSSQTVGATASFVVGEGFDPEKLKVGSVESFGPGGFAGFDGAKRHALHEHSTVTGHSVGFNLKQVQDPAKDGLNLNVGLIDKSTHAVVDPAGRQVTESHKIDVDLRFKIDKSAFIDPKTIYAAPISAAREHSVEESVTYEPTPKEATQEEPLTEGTKVADAETVSATPNTTPETLKASTHDARKKAKIIAMSSAKKAEDKDPGAKSEKPAKPIVGPKAHTTRNYTDSKGTKHHSSVKDGKFSKSGSKKAIDSLRKGESDPKLRAELDYARDERLVYQDELGLIPGFPTTVAVQTTAYIQSNAHLDSMKPGAVKDPKVFEAKAAVTGLVITPLYSTTVSSRAGEFKGSVDGPSAIGEAGAYIGVKPNGQIEEYIGAKAWLLGGIARANYQSPNICVKDFCAQVGVTLEVGAGIGVEAATGNVSHRTGHATTSTATTKVGAGLGPMFAVRTRVTTTVPESKFDRGDAVLPPPFNNPMLSGAGVTPMEMLHSYNADLRRNAIAEARGTTGPETDDVIKRYSIGLGLD